MSTVTRYDLDQGQGYDAGGAYMRVEPNGGDYVLASDYDALQKLNVELEVATKVHADEGCEGCKLAVLKWEAFNG